MYGRAEGVGPKLALGSGKTPRASQDWLIRIFPCSEIALGTLMFKNTPQLGIRGERAAPAAAAVDWALSYLERGQCTDLQEHLTSYDFAFQQRKLPLARFSHSKICASTSIWWYLICVPNPSWKRDHGIIPLQTLANSTQESFLPHPPELWFFKYLLARHWCIDSIYSIFPALHRIGNM